MPIDPSFQAFLATPGVELQPPPPGVTAAMMRDAMKAAEVPAPPLPQLHSTADIAVAGAAGSLKARIFRPTGDKSLPLVAFFHGGGFVLCDVDTHDPLCRELAVASGSVVVSVDYRCAPETRFPGPAEDCYAALCDLVSRGEEIGIDPTRVAVAGDSAGANLATVAALMACDRGGPALRYQALLYPCLDPHCDSESMHALARGHFLTREMLLWFWSQYLAKPADADNPIASPLRAIAPAGLPPATIVTAEYDPCRDEGEAYAAHLRNAGIAVATRRYPGMLHGFASMPLVTDMAGRAVADIAGDLQAALTA